MNYEKLLELARERAKAEAEQFWPETQAYMRTEMARKLTLRYYLEFICPITVLEAQ